MAKFPSQNRIWYETPSIGTNATAVGHASLPKDLSIINRRGYASTTRKGVPLVFRCKVDYYLQDTEGVGVSAAVGSDFASTLHIEGVQNNWVMRNAAVKWHAAREAMFKRAGVKRSDRGAYSSEIRYNYDGASDAYLSPLDANGDAFTGGTWDPTTLVTDADSSVQLKLTGLGLDEESSYAAGALNFAHSYLMSRGQLAADTNEHVSETPAKFSMLNQLLAPADIGTTTRDNIVDESTNAQDNPPYELIDISDSGDVNHDITESVNLGVAIATLGNGFGSTIVDVPFGIMNMVARNHDAAGTSVTTTGSVAITVLDIYEMQG